MCSVRGPLTREEANRDGPLSSECGEDAAEQAVRLASLGFYPTARKNMIQPIKPINPVKPINPINHIKGAEQAVRLVAEYPGPPKNG